MYVHVCMSCMMYDVCHVMYGFTVHVTCHVRIDLAVVMPLYIYIIAKHLIFLPPESAAQNGELQLESVVHGQAAAMASNATATLALLIGHCNEPDEAHARCANCHFHIDAAAFANGDADVHTALLLVCSGRNIQYVRFLRLALRPHLLLARAAMRFPLATAQVAIGHHSRTPERVPNVARHKAHVHRRARLHGKRRACVALHFRLEIAVGGDEVEGPFARHGALPNRQRGHFVVARTLARLQVQLARGAQ